MKAFLSFTFSFILIFSIHAQSNALDFDDVDDYVTVPNASSLISGSATMSMSCWVYPTNPAASFPNFDGFLGFRNNSNADFYLLQLNSTNVEARFRNSSGTNFDVVQGGLVLNTWQHFVMTYNGSTLSVYLNGVLGGSTPANGSINSLTQAFQIGKLDFGATGFLLNGQLDDVGLWSKALTANEVACMYQRGIDPSDSNLELYYDFNQGVAGGNNAGITNLTDRKGNIDGQMIGFGLNGTTSNFVSGIDGHTQQQAQICSGNTYAFAGQTLTSSGVYYDVLPVAASCDSIVALTLIVNDTVFGTDTRNECSPFTWIDGNVYSNDNNTAQFTLVGQAASGCDSTVNLDLTFYTPSGIDQQTACGSFTWINGVTYTSSNNTAMDTLVGGSAIGCDSIVSLNLTMISPTFGVDVQTACESFVWIDGQTYTASNNTAMDTIAGGAANGCDSVVSLDLTILLPATSITNASDCESFTWVDGLTYTASNNTATFTYPGAAANGCDSIVSLNLTIFGPSLTTDVVSSCGPFTWINGNSYATDNNTATFTIAAGAANGCDSVVTLNLTVNSIDAGVTLNNMTLSANATGVSYQWLDCDNNYSTITGETNATFSPLFTGNYALEVSGNSCNDTSACIIVVVSGILDNNFDTEVKAYPIPVQEICTVDLGGNYANIEMKMYNVLGKLIHQASYNEVQYLPVSLEHETSGIYFIHITDDENRKVQVRVVKD